MRLTVGILFVVLATRTCTQARAQDVQQPAKASACQADPSESALDGCGRAACSDQGSSVYGQVEALFMKREPRLVNQPIVVDPNTGTTFLSTSDLGFKFDPGLRATVGVDLCGGRALEFTYFDLFQGTASGLATRPDANAFLTFPNNLFGNVFVGMDLDRVSYSSRVQSFELNLPCHIGCCECCDTCGCGALHCRSFEWLAGFRYIDLNEELNILAQKTVSGAVEEGTYDIRTSNRLFGAQLGARLRRSSCQFGWEATGKAGVFANDAQERQSVVDFPTFPIRPTVSSSGNRTAFVGEFNLSAFCRLTDIWSLRGGYNVMWIEGLALAPDQLDFNFATSPSGNVLHNNGGMFLHGVNVGLEARW